MRTEEIRWVDDQQHDRYGGSFTLGGHRFDFVDHEAAGGVPAPPADAFNVLKPWAMFKRYEEALDGLGPVGTMVELGIFHGGSTALFNELLKPRRLVAFDIAPASPSAYLDRYAAEEGLELHWGADQSDRRRLLDTTGPDPIDLVIDDASHFRDLTATSFEILFPQVREGGLYVIEDWGWSYGHIAERGKFSMQPSMAEVLLDFAGLVISRRGSIAKITVYPSFFVIERGPANLEGLDLRSDVYRRSSWRLNRLKALPRRAARRARRALSGG